MPRKSQAALEFLTTYAWAFLVIIIMIGALAYFGVLSPSKLLPDRCNFGSEIGCNKDFMVVKDADTGTLTMRVENNFGTAVTIPIGGVTITTDIQGITGCTEKIDTTDTTTTAYTWDSDKTVSLTADCTNAAASLVPKEKVKFQIEIKYFPVAAGATYTKFVYGEVFTTIQT